jgi:hypothetical protein
VVFRLPGLGSCLFFGDCSLGFVFLSFRDLSVLLFLFYSYPFISHNRRLNDTTQKLTELVPEGSDMLAKFSRASLSVFLFFRGSNGDFPVELLFLFYSYPFISHNKRLNDTTQKLTELVPEGSDMLAKFKRPL